MTTVKRALRSIFSFDKNAVERQLALLCLVLAIGVRLWDPAPIELLRLKTFDLYQWLMPWEPPGQTVTIIDLDEESLAEVGQWPWPRTIIADMVNKLTAAGVVAIGFDVVFPEPDRMSAPAIANSLRSLEFDGKNSRMS